MQEEELKPVDRSQIQADIEANEKLVPDLLQVVQAEEELVGKQVSIKETLVTFIDGYMQRADLTTDQRDQLAGIRAKILISLTAF